MKDEKTDNKGLMLSIVVGLGMLIIGGLLLAGVEIETTIIGAVAGMLFAFVGILFLPEFFQKRRRLRQVCTTKVDARVVKVDSHLSTDGRNRPIRLYDPIYEFQLKGKMVRARCWNFTNILTPKEGQIVPILVNPDNPQEIDDKRSRAMDIATIIILLCFIIGGTIVYILSICGVWTKG